MPVNGPTEELERVVLHHLHAAYPMLTTINVQLAQGWAQNFQPPVLQQHFRLLPEVIVGLHQRRQISLNRSQSIMPQQRHPDHHVTDDLLSDLIRQALLLNGFTLVWQITLEGLERLDELR